MLNLLENVRRVINTLPVKPIASALLAASLLACQQGDDSASSKERAKEHAVQLQFQAWLKNQPPQQVQAYQQLLSRHLQHPPSLFELTYNSHPAPKDCLYEPFAMPPETLWANIIPPLKLLEDLSRRQVITPYHLSSTYRDPAANICIRGAKASKHLSNTAIDFQLEDSAASNIHVVEQRLCSYWKQYGRNQKMGLGIYGRGRFHIDVQGYRTWGQDYKRASSACVQSG